MAAVLSRVAVKAIVFVLVAGVWLLITAAPAAARTTPTQVAPGIVEAEEADTARLAPQIEVATPDEPTGVNVAITSEDEGLSQSVLIVMLLTVGSVAPGILLMMTSFTRFAIVLSLTRNAVGAQQIPPNQVLMGLALFLTFFVMSPVLTQINDDAVQPLLNGEIEQGEAFSNAYAPLQRYMLAQTDEDDLGMFFRLAEVEAPANPEEVEPSTLIPAFVLSELRSAFTIGFVIFIPFLVIDLVVASVLMSMGMVMLPPVFISLPIKLLLFVLVDGWALIIGAMVASVGVA